MPADISHYRGLLEQVRTAPEGSQALDEAVHALLLPDDLWWQAIRRGRELVEAGRADEKIDACNCNLRADSWAQGSRVAGHSTSIDAAVALVTKLLPGWKVGTAGPDPTRPGLALKAWAKVEPWLNNDDGWKIGAHEGFAATVPLAILAALLTAKISMEESADAN